MKWVACAESAVEIFANGQVRLSGRAMTPEHVEFTPRPPRPIGGTVKNSKKIYTQTTRNTRPVRWGHGSRRGGRATPRTPITTVDSTY